MYNYIHMDYSHPITSWVHIPHTPDCVFKHHTIPIYRVTDTCPQSLRHLSTAVYRVSDTCIQSQRHLSTELEIPVYWVQTPVYRVTITSLQLHTPIFRVIDTWTQTWRHLSTESHTSLYVYRVGETYIKSHRDLSTKLKHLSAES